MSGRVAQRAEWRRAALWLAALSSVAFGAAVSLHPGGPQRWTSVDDVGQCIAPFIASLACAVAGRRALGRERGGWFLISGGSASWGVGQIVWTVSEVGFGHQPESPSASDVGFLLSPVLLVCGLLLFVETPAALLSRLRGAFEAALITAGMLLATWAVLLEPVVARSNYRFSEQLVTLAYPVLDAVALATLVFTASRRRSNSWGNLTLLGSGFVCLAVADSAFWYLTTVRSYESVNPSDAGWFVGFLLVAAGASGSPRRQPHASAAALRRYRLSRDRRTRLTALLPELVALAGVAIAIGHEVAVGARPTAAHLFILSALVVVALLHGVFVLIENHALTTHLEVRINERTAELGRRERHFSALVEHSAESTLVLTSDLEVYSATQSTETVVGMGARLLLGRRLDSFDNYFDALIDSLLTVHATPGRVRQVTWATPIMEGTQRILDSHITNLLDDPDVGGYVINTRDVTERTRLEREIRHQAFHDNLSGLANRALFHDRGQHAIERARRTGSRVAVMLIDLDGFKHVNDSLGHHAGDELLRQVSDRLAAHARVGDTLARLGGDEFAILMEDVSDPGEATALADRVRDHLSQATPGVDYPGYTVTASIGVTLSSHEESTIDQLLRDADIAMYVAKSNGKNSVQQFEPWMHARASERFRLQTELAGALERDEFVLHYQPSWMLGSERLEGFEALIRWEHPVLGTIPPDRFISLAEENGQIVALGNWILRTATSQLAEWTRECPDLDDLTMAINVSARQILDPHLADTIRDAVQSAGIDPTRVVLEITESVLVDKPAEVSRVLTALKAEGIRIAIDDFGTGYSSLSYLQDLPIDILKVDKAFIDPADVTDTEPRRMLGAIINLAKTLGLQTIAEGVETLTQAATLTGHGCDIGQGFLWARPLSAAHATALVTELSESSVTNAA